MERGALPARQIAVCQRLRLWREKHGMTRVSFAAAVGMKADSYSMYETARAPVRYELAHQILAVFSINPGWLATGDGPDSVEVPIPSAEKLGVSPRALFSEVYDTRLAADVERKTAEVIASLTWRPPGLSAPDKPPMDGQARVLMEEDFFSLIGEYFWRFPDDQLCRFVNATLEHGRVIEESFPPLSPDVLHSRKSEMEKARAFIAKKRKELGL